MATLPYTPLRAARSVFLPVRGLRYRTWQWGDASLVAPGRPPLVLMHGWMDVGASFQFVVDELARLEGERRFVIAADWRGFGASSGGGADSFWFPDYLGDLDALLDALSPGASVDLVGHSMGGNVVMSYAGVRPARVRRLPNLAGFGLPRSAPAAPPARRAAGGRPGGAGAVAGRPEGAGVLGPLRLARRGRRAPAQQQRPPARRQ